MLVIYKRLSGYFECKNFIMDEIQTLLLFGDIWLAVG